MPFDGLVDVHTVEEGHVKAGEPHIHHDGDFKIGFSDFELYGMKGERKNGRKS